MGRVVARAVVWAGTRGAVRLVAPVMARAVVVAPAWVARAEGSFWG